MLFLDRNKVSSYFWTVENLGRPRQAFHNFSIRSTMAKGSQLSQLKSALNQAGLSRQSSSKKRKRSTVSLREHDKEKKEQKRDKDSFERLRVAFSLRWMREGGSTPVAG